MKNKQLIKDALELVRAIQGSIADDRKDSVHEELSEVILLLEKHNKSTAIQLTSHELLLLVDRIIVVTGMVASVFEKFVQ